MDGKKLAELLIKKFIRPMPARFETKIKLAEIKKEKIKESFMKYFNYFWKNPW